MQAASHQTVLLQEAVDALAPKVDGVYVDGTFGRGGHGLRILSMLGDQGKLIVFDRDPDAVACADALLGDDERVVIVHAAFSSIKEQLQALGLYRQVDGILLDLGVSSPQLDEAQRGFSFQKDGPLDMRMDSTQGLTAAQWVEQTDEEEIIRVLRRYGEERFAKRIAFAIKQALLEQPIETTLQLATIIDAAVPFKEKDKHPATRSFQAIRIAVNAELQELEAVLPDAFDALQLKGRLVVISFHSLEDRMVKTFFRKEAKGDPYPIDLPIQASQIQPRLNLVGKPQRASADEVAANRRSRSAIMRVAEKLSYD